MFVDTPALQPIRVRDAAWSLSTALGRARFQRAGTPTCLSIISTRIVAIILLRTSSSLTQRVMSKNMAKNGEISRDGRGETWLTNAQKNRILWLARMVPRDELLLGLQLERGWRIGSIVGCHNRVAYTRKRTGEKVVCVVDLPGIGKEDVGPETIVVRFKGGRTEADYPGKK